MKYREFKALIDYLVAKNGFYPSIKDFINLKNKIA